VVWANDYFGARCRCGAGQRHDPAPRRPNVAALDRRSVRASFGSEVVRSAVLSFLAGNHDHDLALPVALAFADKWPFLASRNCHDDHRWYGLHGRPGIVNPNSRRSAWHSSYRVPVGCGCAVRVLQDQSDTSDLESINRLHLGFASAEALLLTGNGTVRASRKKAKVEQRYGKMTTQDLLVFARHIGAILDLLNRSNLGEYSPEFR
jgi:hypothetical protein